MTSTILRSLFAPVALLAAVFAVSAARVEAFDDRPPKPGPPIEILDCSEYDADLCVECGGTLLSCCITNYCLPIPVPAPQPQPSMFDRLPTIRGGLGSKAYFTAR